MRRGFTLLELVVALALAAALTAIAVPAGQRLLAGWQLNAAARQVIMDLKLARGQAIGDSTSHRVKFTVPGSTYQHERQRAGTYSAVGPVVRLPEGISILDCTATGAGVGFRPRGYAATFGTITLSNRFGEERSVVVDIAGRMRVQ